MGRKNGHNRRLTCKHPEGAHHDCVYVDRVNALIPAAVTATEQVMKETDTRQRDAEYASAWSRVFLEEMQSLCETSGLRRPGPRQ